MAVAAAVVVTAARAVAVAIPLAMAMARVMVTGRLTGARGGTVVPAVGSAGLGAGARAEVVAVAQVRRDGGRRDGDGVRRVLPRTGDMANDHPVLILG